MRNIFGGILGQGALNPNRDPAIFDWAGRPQPGSITMTATPNSNVTPPAAFDQSGNFTGATKHQQYEGVSQNPYSNVPLRRNPSVTPMGTTGALPNPNAQGLGFNDQLQRVTDRILGSIKDANAFNIAQKDKAVHSLLDLSTKVSGEYGNAIDEAGKALPLNPFSDALKESIMSNANDQITRETQQQYRDASLQLASRGLQTGGSTAQTAAGGVFQSALANRVNTRVGLEKSQLDFNTTSNQARTGIIDQLVTSRANSEAAINSLSAQIQQGNVIDPQAAADTLGQAYGIQLSKDNMQKMLDFINSTKATLGQKFAQFLPAIVSGFLPSATGVQALSTLPTALLGTSGSFSMP